MNEVRVGQIWRDNDKRNYTRWVEVVSIEGEKATVINLETRKQTRISLKRFKPNATGYVLVKDAK
jgi:desulfoferrodoxin (superoxide reductase-like protein)